jgi:hypothetical protein
MHYITGMQLLCRNLDSQEIKELDKHKKSIYSNIISYREILSRTARETAIHTLRRTGRFER